MLTIQAFSIITLLATSTLVSAHGHITAWTVNGQKKPGYNPAWPPQLGSTANRPTDNTDLGPTDHNSGIVACGSWNAGNNVETWDLDAGSTVTARWDEWDWGHRGPVLEYMARCPGTSCNGVAADSLDWFKISEATYANGKWPTETVTAGLDWSFKIPSDLAPGPYLVRHELIAMHRPNEPQVYPVCFQANLKGSGSAYPGNTVRFPAAYNLNPRFKTFNLYWQDDPNTFVPPGPKVYSGGGGGAAPAASAASSPSASPKPAASPSTIAPALVDVGKQAVASSAAPAAASPAPTSSTTTSTAAATSSAAAVKTPPKCKHRVKRVIRKRQAERALAKRHSERSRGRRH